MNDTFNPGRFVLLLRKTILERAMQIIGLLVFVLAFTLIMYSLFYYLGGWSMAQNLSFIWGFIGGGTLLAATVFNYFNTNAGGSAYLTLPASALEKWLCGTIIVGVLFCLAFFGFFRLVDYSFVTIYRNGLDHTSPLYQRQYNAVYVYPFVDNNVVSKSIIMFVNFTGAMLVGSLYFNKVAIVKVALVFCGAVGIIYFLNLLVAHILFKDVDIAFPYYTVLIKLGSEVGNIELPAYASKIADATLLYILPGIMWMTAYVRLREKEI